MNIRAAIFRGGQPVVICSSLAFNLNGNLFAPGDTWREIPPNIQFCEDVPPLDSLPPHPGLVEPT